MLRKVLRPTQHPNRLPRIMQIHAMRRPINTRHPQNSPATSHPATLSLAGTVFTTATGK
jgi:hypothetical protein